jgi:chromosome segregation and condensation protein ScpB
LLQARELLSDAVDVLAEFQYEELSPAELDTLRYIAAHAVVALGKLTKFYTPEVVVVAEQDSGPRLRLVPEGEQK